MLTDCGYDISDLQSITWRPCEIWPLCQHGWSVYYCLGFRLKHRLRMLVLMVSKPRTCHVYDYLILLLWVLRRLVCTWCNPTCIDVVSVMLNNMSLTFTMAEGGYCKFFPSFWPSPFGLLQGWWYIHHINQRWTGTVTWVMHHMIFQPNIQQQHTRPGGHMRVSEGGWGGVGWHVLKAWCCHLWRRPCSDSWKLEKSFQYPWYPVRLSPSHSKTSVWCNHVWK